MSIFNKLTAFFKKPDDQSIIDEGREFARELYDDGFPIEALIALISRDDDMQKFNEGIELECAIIFAMEEKEHATIN